jgi:hypothetical protein
MKKEYNFSKLKELKNPYAGKKKAVGDQLESEGCGLFQSNGGGNRTALPEVDRSLSSRLREEAQETDHEVGGVAQGAWDALAT